jgi:predicted ATPase
LRSALGLMQAEQYHVLTIAFHRALAEGLIQIGEIDEAAVVIDAALARSEALDELSNVSELLRVRGEVWLRTTPADSGAAENAFQRSREQAKSQSALSLELRSTMALVQLWSSQGKATDAAELLEDIYRRFSEGHDTVDLRHAGHLLATLERHSGSPDTANGSL